MIITFSGLLERLEELVKDNGPVFAVWAGPYPFLHLTQPKDMEVGDKLLFNLQIFVNSSINEKYLSLYYFNEYTHLFTQII